MARRGAFAPAPVIKPGKPKKGQKIAGQIVLPPNPAPPSIARPGRPTIGALAQPPAQPGFGVAWRPPPPPTLGAPPRYDSGPKPPLGTYNPALDAQERAAYRGYVDTRTDTNIANQRGYQDYATNRRDIRIANTRGERDLADTRADTWQDYLNTGSDLVTSRDRSLGDISRGLGRQESDYTQGVGRLREDATTGRTRLTEDATTGRTRQGEDYGRATSVLGRTYANLGSAQNQQGRSQGLMGGGFAAQAAAKRAANQAFEQEDINSQNTRRLQDIDTQSGRGLQDIDRSESRGVSDLDTSIGRVREDSAIDTTRVGEDFGRDQTRLGQGLARAARELNQSGKRLEQDTGTAYGKLGIGYQRGAQDRALNLGKAGREYGAYKSDIGEARFYEARANTPGALPRYRPGKQPVAGDPYHTKQPKAKGKKKGKK